MVHRGLARSRRRAAELVAEGRVSVGGGVARKPAQPVGEGDELHVTSSSRPEYVSRAGYKLAGALDAVAAMAPGAVMTAGARCLDAGACTGGFTQVLLERGAAHVVAADVGHGQLAPVLAREPAVTVLERTDVRDLTAQLLGDPPSLVVADLSFISLRLVVGHLVTLAAAGADLLLMVKPQFEVGRERLGTGGVVRSDELRCEALLGVAAVALGAGARVRGVVPSPLPGPAGNREYFLWLVAPRGDDAGAGSRTGTDDTGPRTACGPVREAVRAAVTDDRPVLVGGGPSVPPAATGPDAPVTDATRSVGAR